MTPEVSAAVEEIRQTFAGHHAEIAEDVVLLILLEDVRWGPRTYRCRCLADSLSHVHRVNGLLRRESHQSLIRVSPGVANQATR